MTCRPVLIALIAGAVLASGCGSSSGTSNADAAVAEIDDAAATTEPPPRGGVAGAVEVAVSALDGADTVACDLDHRMLADASEMYLALNGALPGSQSDLVDAQLLTELSPRFEITTDGLIVPATGSPCD